MTPQHFQQQDRFTQYLAAQYYHLLNPARFGFSALEIDVQSLKSGKFCISYASGVLPDNTPILIDVPLAIDVAPTVSDALVTLALPVVCEGSAQVRADPLPVLFANHERQCSPGCPHCPRRYGPPQPATENW